MPEDWDNTTIATNKAVLSNLYKEKPHLEFTPGEKSSYSNLGYMVLAEIVEKTSGMEFESYLKKNIFKPAKMNNTAIYDAKESKGVDNVAKGYLFYPFTGKYEEAVKLDEFASNYAISGLVGDGNVYSTTNDLFRFTRALKSGKLISKEAVDEAFRKHIATNDKYGTSFGYGWTIANAPSKVVQRGGELPGYVANIIWDVTKDNLLIYLVNDYLHYISYHREIYPAYAGVMYSDKLNIPKFKASTELTKIAVKSSLSEMEAKIKEIKKHPELYQLDVNGLHFLVQKLKQLGENEKAALMMRSFNPE